MTGVDRPSLPIALAAGVAAEATDPARNLATLTLLVGGMLVLARLLGLATLIDNISLATLTGIKVGVGLTVAAGQLPKLLGVPGDPTADNFFAEMRAVFDQFGAVSWVTVAFSAATIAVMLGINESHRRFPARSWRWSGESPWSRSRPWTSTGCRDRAGALRAPDAGDPGVRPRCSTAAGCFRDRDHGVPRDPRGGPAACARRRSRRSTTTRSCSPAAGAASPAHSSGPCRRPAGFSQTAINQRAGARTQLSELVTVALALACALSLGGVLSDLPEATLGCLVVVAVLGLIRPAEFARFWRLSRLEFWVRRRDRGQRPVPRAVGGGVRWPAAHPAARPRRARPCGCDTAAAHRRRSRRLGHRTRHHGGARAAGPAL